MRLQFSKIGLEKITIVSLMLGLVHLSTAQQVDTTTQMVNFKVTGSVTNNGFSFIPAFSLGKPAAIFNLNINGGKRFSFEPEFRFALQDGRPWSFILVLYEIFGTGLLKLSLPIKRQWKPRTYSPIY